MIQFQAIMNSLRIDREGSAKLSLEISMTETPKILQIPTERILNITVELEGEDEIKDKRPKEK